MDRIARGFFSDLFTTKGVAQFDYLLSDVVTCIIEEMNHSLTRDYIMEEVVLVLKEMGPTISPSVN